MKHKGSNIECTDERDADLLRAYKELVCSCDVIVISDIMQTVVNMPSSRFWVSEERTAIIIARMMRGDTLEGMNALKREMFFEIYNRAMVMKQRNPKMPLVEIAFHVIRQPAPKFYLTPKSAEIFINRKKKQIYEERKRRLRHMFNSSGN